MAEAKLTLTVSVEAAISDGLRRVLNEVARDHGIEIETIDATWIRFGATLDEAERFEVDDLTLRTRSRRK